MKVIDLLMKFLTDRMPRKAALASIAIVGTLLLFLVLIPTLGAAHDQAVEKNGQLKSSIAKTTKDLGQAKDDHKYVVEHQQEYEDLLHGDRLVPHTDRVAIAQLTTLGRARGLTALSYNFTAEGTKAAGGSGGKAAKGGYQLKLEKVSLKVGAPLDTQLYDFMLDLGEDFPGAAVLESFQFERAPEISTEALNQVAHGQDSGLAKGQIDFTWRTAEKEEDQPNNKNNKGKK